MLVGYELLRESGSEELLRLLKKAGCQKIYSDLLSKENRTGLEQALEFVGVGDTLIVRRLDRLGKTVWLVLKTIHRLMNKGVALRSLEENLLISASSTGIELLEVLKSFEEKAIELRSRTREATFQKNGKRKGRPPIKEEVRQLAQRLANEQMTVQEICKFLNISRATYYNYFPQAKRK